MSVILNKAGYKQALRLIEDGKIDFESNWSFEPEDGNKLLGPDGDDWGNYSKYHLGRETEEAPETKAAWKYPHGKA